MPLSNLFHHPDSTAPAWETRRQHGHKSQPESSQITTGAALSVEGEGMGWALSLWRIAYEPHCAQELSLLSAETVRLSRRKTQPQMYPTKCLIWASLLKLRGWAGRIPSVHCKHSRKMPWTSSSDSGPITLLGSHCAPHPCLKSLFKFFKWYKETGPKFCKENLTFNRILLFIVWRIEKSRMKTAAQDLRQTQRLAVYTQAHMHTQHVLRQHQIPCLMRPFQCSHVLWRGKGVSTLLGALP